ncbi:hypothetical protein [Paenibacillus agilis]|uniref:DUF5050 domain-containing protein n=1 Tax=Paenibacillus agilis TaxID=3020863 RepID=A0A559IGJ5_9BACL|nr:hypothetical protein [Paenibacillus agilis]TVX86795.1 hypothetical protein FPZ44_23015 [Paenibacillus agilis]
MNKKYRIGLASGILLLSIGGYLLFNKGIENAPPEPSNQEQKEIATEPPNKIDEKEVKPTQAKIKHVEPIKYMIKDKRFESAPIAPSYISDTILAFEYDISEAENVGTSAIAVMNRSEKKSFQVVYTAKKNKIINALVGVKNELFWVEYDRSVDEEWNWEVKSLHLKTNKVIRIEGGALLPDLEPPVLRMSGGIVTWIRKSVHNKVITSSAIAYDPSKKETKIIAETTLDETMKKRDGIFMIIQRPIQGGMLIQQSTFNPKIEKNEGKSIQVAFYPYDKSKAPELMQEDADRVIDFTANDKWFVWTTFGKLYAADRSTREIKHIIEGPDPELTLDTPFIYNDLVYYRYSMYQIYCLDLVSGTVTEYSPDRLITSKLFNSDGYLGFSYSGARDTSGEYEMNVIKVDE